MFSCGNDMQEGTETCDGDDLNGATCVTQGFDGGTLACAGNCMGFDTSGCFDCGDNVQEGTEVCDGTDISEGTSEDCNSNDIPDECEADADTDGAIDDCDETFVNGQRIELISLDDKFEAKNAVENAKKLIDDGVVGKRPGGR